MIRVHLQAYREATTRTPFAAAGHRDQQIYRRLVERDSIVEAMVKKRPLFTGPVSLRDAASMLV